METSSSGASPVKIRDPVSALISVRSAVDAVVGCCRRLTGMNTNERKNTDTMRCKVA